MQQTSNQQRCLQEIQELKDRLAGGCTNLALHELGVMQRRAGQISDSLESFERALQLDHFNYKTHIEVAKSLLLNAEYSRCIEFCDSSIAFFEAQQLKGQLWHLFQLKGLALASFGDVQMALDPLFRAYELNPNFATKFAISQLQSPADAQETLSDILQFAPAHLRALLDLARIYFNGDQYETAFDFYSRASMAAQRSFQASPEALFGVAFLLQNEEPEAALQKYRQAGQQYGGNFNDGHAWANLAVLFAKMHRMPAALSSARRAFQLTKDDRVRSILGQIYLQQKDYLRAFQTMSYFAGADDCDAKWVLGVAAIELGEAKIGFSQLLRAASDSFGAAACGLRYALLQHDIELAKRFAALLRQSTAENQQEKAAAKRLLRVLKIRLAGGQESDEQKALEEQQEEEWENDEE